MSKQPTSFDYSANAQGLLKTGVDLAGQKAKMLQHKPTGYEAEANLFKNIRAGMTGKRKPWHQTVSEGLINGAEYGLQSKQVESKKADYDKVENFFNYFEQTLACLNYDNNRNAERTKLMENARPYAMGMLNNNFSGLSYEQANQSNQELFQQAKLNNPNIKGDYVGFIPATDTLLIRRENGEILPFSLATLLPEDAIKDARQAQIDRQNANSSQMQAQARMMSAHTGQDNSRIAQERLQMDQVNHPKQMEIDRDRVAAYQHDINNRWNPQSQFDSSSAKVQGSEGAKRVHQVRDENLEFEDIYYDIKSLENLLQKGQVITGETLRAKSSRLWAGISGNKALSDSETYDATAKSLIKFANNHATFGNANTKEFDFLRAPVPDSHKTKEANLALLDRFSRKLKTHMDRNEKFISQYENFNRFSTPEKTSLNNEVPQATQTPPTSTQDVNSQSSPTQTPPAPTQGGGSVPRVKMVNPDGSVVALSRDQVARALQKGYTKP